MKQALWGGGHSQLRPHRIVGARLRYIAAAMTAVGVSAMALELMPPAGSPTWWLLIVTGSLSALIALIRWDKVPPAANLSAILTMDALGAAVLWLNTGNTAVSMVFAFITIFVATRYQVIVVGSHMAVVLLSLGVHIWRGGDLGETVIVGTVLMAVSGFGLALNLALQREHTGKRSLQSLLDLLPVLKAHGVNEVVEAAVSQLVKVTTSDSGVVFLLNQERQMLNARYISFNTPVAPEEEEAWSTVEFPIGHGLVGWAVEHRQSLMTGNAAQDPRGYHLPGTPDIDESILIVPLITRGRVYGVLRLTRYGLYQYEQADLDLLEVMAAHVADALSRADLEERMARTDALTGAYNRHFLNEWSQVLKSETAPISVLMIDCRQFKQINDKHGHLAGDRVLQEVARLIRANIRSGDLVVRYGGDEFLVVLRRMTEEHAMSIADRIHRHAEDWNAEQGSDGPVIRLDIGIDSDVECRWLDLLERADAQMYASIRSAS